MHWHWLCVFLTVGRSSSSSSRTCSHCYCCYCFLLLLFLHLSPALFHSLSLCHSCILSLCMPIPLKSMCSTFIKCINAISVDRPRIQITASHALTLIFFSRSLRASAFSFSFSFIRWTTLGVFSFTLSLRVISLIFNGCMYVKKFYFNFKFQTKPRTERNKRRRKEVVDSVFISSFSFFFSLSFHST